MASAEPPTPIDYASPRPAPTEPQTPLIGKLNAFNLSLIGVGGMCLVGYRLTAAEGFIVVGAMLMPIVLIGGFAGLVAGLIALGDLGRTRIGLVTLGIAGLLFGSAFVGMAIGSAMVMPD